MGRMDFDRIGIPREEIVGRCDLDHNLRVDGHGRIV